MRKLQPSFHERVWGVTSLAPWFPDAPTQTGKLIGEVWFETPEIPLLVKFLFTREKLSVQVHPDDEYAGLHHHSPGKTEMWHVLAAEPGAKIAAGFREPITKERLREAALSGEIENLLEWHAAAPGDTFFIPAGTVHAIGAGLTICEIQQRSGITYRLYDYGRGRELHLEPALDVSDTIPHAAKCELPVACRYFVTEAVEISGAAQLPAAAASLLVVIGGSGHIKGQSVAAGEVWMPGLGTVEISGQVRLLQVGLPENTQ